MDTTDQINTTDGPDITYPTDIRDKLDSSAFEAMKLYCDSSISQQPDPHECIPNTQKLSLRQASASSCGPNLYETISNSRGPGLYAFSSSIHGPSIHEACSSRQRPGIYAVSSNSRGPSRSSRRQSPELYETSSSRGPSISETRPINGEASSSRSPFTHSRSTDKDPKRLVPHMHTLLGENRGSYRFVKMPLVVAKPRITECEGPRSLQEDIEYTNRFNQKYLEKLVSLRRENIEMEVELALCREAYEASKRELRVLAVKCEWMKDVFMGL